MAVSFRLADSQFGIGGFARADSVAVLPVAIQVVTGPLATVGALPAQLTLTAAIGDVTGRSVDAGAVTDTPDTPSSQRALVLALQRKEEVGDFAHTPKEDDTLVHHQLATAQSTQKMATRQIGTVFHISYKYFQSA